MSEEMESPSKQRSRDANESLSISMHEIRAKFGAAHPASLPQDAQEDSNSNAFAVPSTPIRRDDSVEGLASKAEVVAPNTVTGIAGGSDGAPRRKVRRRRQSLTHVGRVPLTPSGGSATTSPVSVSGTRRKLSNKLLDKFSVFEREPSQSNLVDGPFMSPKPAESGTTPPMSATPRTKRSSKAHKLIERFNEKSKTNSMKNIYQQSPGGPQAGLFSPKEVRDLVRSNHGTRVSALLDAMDTMPLENDNDAGNDKSASKTKNAKQNLLTNSEIRSLIKSSSKNLRSIVSAYEDKSRNNREQQVATTEETLETAKIRRRKFQKLLKQAGKIRNASIRDSRPPRTIENMPSTSNKSAGVLAYQRAQMKGENSVMYRPMEQAMRGTSSEAYKNYLPPNKGPEKTEEQKALISTTVDESFVFQEFRDNGNARNDTTLDVLTNAFETIVAEPGETIIWADKDKKSDSEKGNDENEYFYIVQEGGVDFKVDGSKIGSAAVGESFGEQSLLHPNLPHQASVIAADGDKPTILLKLEQNDYRGILITQALQASAAKRSIIESIDFLKPLLQDDNDDKLMHQLLALLERTEFLQEQTFTIDDEKTFLIVLDGTVALTNPDETWQIELKKEDFFGDKPILDPVYLAPYGDGPLQLTGNSPTGVFFTATRRGIEEALGESRLKEVQDMYALSKRKRFQDVNVEEGLLGVKNRLSNGVRDAVFEEAGQDILAEEDPEKPNIYIVREGTAVIRTTDENNEIIERHVSEGDVFGDEEVVEIQDPEDSGKFKTVRQDGFSATTTGDKPVSIGILAVDDIDDVPKSSDMAEEVVDESEPAATSLAVSKPRNEYENSASFQLQNKIRAAVKANIGLEDLERISKLGEGEFGDVWLVAADVFKTGVDSLKQRFALKTQIRATIDGGDATNAILKEIEVTANFNHPGLVNLINTYEDEEAIHMLLGLIPGGELWSRIHRQDDDGEWTSGLSEPHSQFYTLVVADTLVYMHQNGFIYRDLKPENVMIGEDGYPIIVDFGFTKYCPSDRTFTFCGTPNYVAPEMIKGTGHGRSVDFWALGVVIYEMVSGENPFYYDGLDQMTMYDAILKEEYYALPDEVSDEACHLIRLFLEKEPTNRLGCLDGGLQDIIDHEWFDGWDISRLRAKLEPAPWVPPSNKDEGELDEDAVEDLMASFAVDVETSEPLMPSIHQRGSIIDEVVNEEDEKSFEGEDESHEEKMQEEPLSTLKNEGYDIEEAPQEASSSSLPDVGHEESEISQEASSSSLPTANHGESGMPHETSPSGLPDMSHEESEMQKEASDVINTESEAPQEASSSSLPNEDHGEREDEEEDAESEHIENNAKDVAAAASEMPLEEYSGEQSEAESEHIEKDVAAAASEMPLEESSGEQSETEMQDQSEDQEIESPSSQEHNATSTIEVASSERVDEASVEEEAPFVPKKEKSVDIDKLFEKRTNVRMPRAFAGQWRTMDDSATELDQNEGSKSDNEDDSPGDEKPKTLRKVRSGGSLEISGMQSKIAQLALERRRSNKPKSHKDKVKARKEEEMSKKARRSTILGALEDLGVDEDDF